MNRKNEKGWLGPYAPTSRHADDITLNDYIQLRKKVIELEGQINRAIDQMIDAVRQRVDADHENKRLKEVLRMWVKFWEADNSIDIGGDALLAEEAMEATREILEGEMT
jgi:hypothetical protein